MSHSKLCLCSGTSTSLLQRALLRGHCCSSLGVQLQCQGIASESQGLTEKLLFLGLRSLEGCGTQCLPMGASCSKRAVVRVPVVLSAESSLAATAAWGRVVVKLARIRFLQRCWAYLGHLLQEYPKGLRLRLIRLYPQVK